MPLAVELPVAQDAPAFRDQRCHQVWHVPLVNLEAGCIKWPGPQADQTLNTSTL
jgi:hypothetical protein